jgi:uncharacterized protein (TIRG00374 family)
MHISGLAERLREPTDAPARSDDDTPGVRVSSTDVRRVLLLLVTAISLYLLLPSLLAVFSSFGTLGHLDWIWVGPAVLAEVLSYAAIWELDRIALRTKDWFSVACAQLGGNAVGRVIPGGGATATAFSISMLRRAGVDTGEAAAALSASSLLQIATTLALPLLAIPAIVGGSPVDHGLLVAAYLGFGVALLLLLAGGVAFTTDAPLRDVGRATQWLLNATVRRHRPVSGLADELIEDRDFIRTTLGQHWRGAVAAAAASAVFDYLALLCSLRAVGADPRPSLVLLAYAAAELLALIPLTPGGLGFVEAGLVGTLTLAGVSGPDALASTLLYRLLSFWLPLPAGAVAYWLFGRRYGLRSSRTGSGASPIPQQAPRENSDMDNAQPGGT